MLSYIKGNLTSIDGIEIFPIVSLIIFFSFFVGLGIYVWRSDKNRINEVKNMPLDEE